MRPQHQYKYRAFIVSLKILQKGKKYLGIEKRVELVFIRRKMLITNTDTRDKI